MLYTSQSSMAGQLLRRAGARAWPVAWRFNVRSSMLLCFSCAYHYELEDCCCVAAEEILHCNVWLNVCGCGVQAGNIRCFTAGVRQYSVVITRSACPVFLTEQRVCKVQHHAITPVKLHEQHEDQELLLMT